MVSRHLLPIAEPLPDNLGPLDLNTGLLDENISKLFKTKPNRTTLRQSQERQDWDEAGMLGNRDLTVALVIEAHAGHWTYQTCDAFEGFLPKLWALHSF
jgi:hypothetical protein